MFYVVVTYILNDEVKKQKDSDNEILVNLRTRHSPQDAVITMKNFVHLQDER